MEVSELLKTYPRSRPPLSDGWKKIYVDTYKKSRDGQTFLYKITQHLETWMHRKASSQNPTHSLLEIGAGTLNHIQHENSTVLYDIVEPFQTLYADKPELTKLNAHYSDISEIPLSRRYDHIVSVAALEHIDNLPNVVARAGLLMEANGSFSAGIPSEGGLLWGLSWRLSVGLIARIKHGLDYGDLMRHEHVSTAPEILSIVKYFFRNCEITRFPFPGHNFSLYACIKASDPIYEHCIEYGSDETSS